MLQSAKSKLERAQHHITDLERQLEAFIARKPHRFSVAHNDKTGQPIIQIRIVEDVPESFSVIIGDAIHNLRCVLDHIVWEVVGLDGGTQNKHLMFPARDNRVDFEGAVNGIQTPSAWVKELLRRYEAFPGGRGEPFHLLHNLDIADKHRVIRPVLRATGHPPFQTFDANGTPVLRMQGNRFVGMKGNVVAITNIPRGGHVELDDDADCPPDIFIPEVNQANAIDALKSLSASIAAAITEAEEAIRINIT